MIKKEKQELDIYEVVNLSDSPPEISEIIDISNTIDVQKIPISFTKLKSELIDMKTLSALHFNKSNQKAFIESTSHTKVIEIPSDTEPSSSAPPHPKKRILPFFQKKRASDQILQPGEYDLRRMTHQEILSEQVSAIRRTCSRLSKSSIAVQSANTELNDLIIHCKLILKFLPIKIWRDIKLPFLFTFDQITEIVEKAFGISCERRMFIFYNSKKEKVFLNSPDKGEEETKADREVMKHSALMDVMSFDYSEVILVSGGDDEYWYVSIRINKISERIEGLIYPYCSNGKCVSPPFGIPPSKFSKILRILSTPTDKKHEKYSKKYFEWKSSKFQRNSLNSNLNFS